MLNSFDKMIHDSYKNAGIVNKESLDKNEISILEQLEEVFGNSGYDEFSAIANAAESAIDSIPPQDLKNHSVYMLRRIYGKIILSVFRSFR